MPCYAENRRDKFDHLLSPVEAQMSTLTQDHQRRLIVDNVESQIYDFRSAIICKRLKPGFKGLTFSDKKADFSVS